MTLVLSTQRASIKALLEEASTGRVNDFLRDVSGEKDVAAAFVSASTGKFHTWTICLDEADPYQELRKPANQAFGLTSWVLHGWYALKDADGTEKVWQDIVVAVLNAFREDKKLGDTVIEAGPLQWRENDYRNFADVLCHHAKLTLAVQTQVEP